MTGQKVDRVSPRLLSIVLATLKLSRDAEGKPRTPLIGFTSNVGLEGALVLLPERVPPGTRVTLVLSASDAAAGAPPIEIPATIVWVLKIPHGPLQFQHGLRFLQPETAVVLQAWPGRVLSD